MGAFRPLCCYAALFVIWVTMLAHPDTGSVARPSPASPPDMVFQAVAERETVNRGSSMSVALQISNRSAVSLDDLRVAVLPEDSDFSVKGSQVKNILKLAPVAAFGNESKKLDLLVSEHAEFQSHHLLLVLQYTWGDGINRYPSAQTATLNLQVSRQFEEETKGLPGGTSALLYLILPIITVFLAYQVIDALLKGDGWKIPEFKPAYVFPAFLMAIILNFLLLIEVKQDQSIIYASPKRFASVLFILTVIGSTIPTARWAIRTLRWRMRAFRVSDTTDQYLRKVLEYCSEDEFEWVSMRHGGETWEGVLLNQPEEKFALGAVLQLSARTGGPDYAALTKIIDEKGRILNRTALLQLVKRKLIAVDFADKISRNKRRLDQAVALDRVEKPEFESNGPKSIVQLVN